MVDFLRPRITSLLVEIQLLQGGQSLLTPQSTAPTDYDIHAVKETVQVGISEAVEGAGAASEASFVDHKE